jgi:hypothetical protein
MEEVFAAQLEGLRRYIEGEIRRLEAAIDSERELRRARREDDMLALGKAEESMTRRLDAMNELRDQLNQQAGTFLTREAFEQTLREWTTWRASVDQTLALSAGRGLGISTLSELVFKVIPITLAIISTFMAIYFATGR